MLIQLLCVRKRADIMPVTESGCFFVKYTQLLTILLAGTTVTSLGLSNVALSTCLYRISGDLSQTGNLSLETEIQSTDHHKQINS